MRVRKRHHTPDLDALEAKLRTGIVFYERWGGKFIITVQVPNAQDILDDIERLRGSRPYKTRKAR